MKKQVKRYRIALIPIVVFLFGFSLFTMGAAGSQQQLKPRRQIKPKRAACDLVVERIELDEKCQVRVTIKNQGSAGVADGAYNTPPLKGVAIQAIAENSGWGGYILDAVDPQRKLKTPGASVSFTGFKRALNTGEILTVRMDIINPGNVGNESNLTNNSKTVRLLCKK